MKILYVKLKNFATIYTAMGKKEIEIDFSKSKNKVILLIGANGSGKTSILSSLHPYAYLGSLDVRNNTGLIREGCDGYKEIHFQKGKDIYVIKHNYLFSKKNQVLKSFVSKNGVELNPNGNVGSFNEVIANEFSLRQDFLRLIRLGSNVNNLIDMKATERKSFTSNLLSDIDIYNDLFKKISDDSRVIRGLIKSVSDKINRLNIPDVEIIKADIKKIESDIVEKTKIKDSYQRELGSLENKISTAIPEGIDVLTNKLTSDKAALREMISKRSEITSKMDKSVIVFDGDINTVIDQLREKIMILESDKQTSLNMTDFYKNQLSKLYDTKDSILTKIKMYTTDDDYYKLMNLKVKLTEKISVYKDQFSHYEYTYTKDELLTVMRILYTIDDIAKDIYSFDPRATQEVIRLLREGVNVEKYIDTELSKINLNLTTIASKMKIDTALSSPMVLFKPTNCIIEDCPFIYLYDAIFAKNSSNVTETSLNGKKELLEDMSAVLKNIDYIFMVTKSNGPLITKGAIPYFKIDTILENLSNGKSLYDEELITNMISDAEEYEDYIKSKSDLQEVSLELQSRDNKQSDLESLKIDLTKTEEEISKLLKEIHDEENKIKNINDNISDESSILSDSIQYNTLMHELNELSVDISRIESDIQIKEYALNSVSDLQSRVSEVNGLINNSVWEIEKLNSELFTKKVAMQDFVKLSDEKTILNEKFDDIELIRESLSPTKGIPLLYIQLYLKNTSIFVNSLLQSVYGNDFAIDDFDITPTEFNIPYIKNGVRVNDVAYASQGEKSFLSLALSFALINQSIKDYNILLLDEIDSTLDTKNRAMFLNILEKQIDIIDADQIFLITHNNMFDSYPVDVILTSDYHIGNYNNANVIYDSCE